MRKLVGWNLMSLDGYFEGDTPWDLAFHLLAWGADLRSYALSLGEETDFIVFGRKTYEGMAAHWPDTTEELDIKAYMNAKPKGVASRTLHEATWNNTRVLADAVSELRAMKVQCGKTIFVFGSAELQHMLLEAELVDEIRVCVAPVLLGTGSPLFKHGPEKRLTLLEARPVDTGAVILRYAVRSD
ncbi:dihydrofolate reductase family protein [Rhizobium glycinendophyticum]|uniref:Dihydrofolate reductase n=1 Tax=Rhizobium glycinendophyticum TaxID=2589807 RepID=A0A504U424_9HYPH|nr:dihydrofolate reductase family protein [Rhizobium glycinendophyticum]TPP09754.1 dihydrofolate reductase [Rhizobium glycinendophyticum]